MQDAYLYLAQTYVGEEAKRLNVTLTWNAFDPVTFCSRASIAPRSDPMSAAKSYCSLLRFEVNTVYNNMAVQIEMLGHPLSWGGEGEGARLVLGTDITGRKGLYSDGATEGTTAVNTTTKWLLAASPATFDPRCAYSDILYASAADCAAVGTFKSCGTGCKLNAYQESLWENLQLPLGYPSNSWFPATGKVWRDLRGVLTGFKAEQDPSASGDGGDTLALLEKGDIFLGFIPFDNMTDRPYWIVNETVSVPMQQLLYDNMPKFDEFPPKRIVGGV